MSSFAVVDSNVSTAIDFVRWAPVVTTCLAHAVVAGDHDRLTLFRRAIIAGDQACWNELFTLYHGQVQAWCRLAGARDTDHLDDLALGTWERFWQNYTPAKFAAGGGLASALAYLKLCARSVVIDAFRAGGRAIRRSAAALPPSEPAGSPPEQAVDPDFWAIIGRYLRSEQELVLVRLKYVLDLKPAEIQALRPDLFPTIASVYRVTRNVLDRLGRSAELRSCLRATGSLE